MKKYLFTLMSCAGLFMTACSNSDTEDIHGGNNDPVKKPTVNIPLTRSEEEVVKSLNEFAFDLIKTFNEENSNGDSQNTYNYIISPLGASMAISMLANGCEGETMAEILDVLKIGSESIEDLNTCCKTLLESFADPKNEIDMTVNNIVYSRDRGFNPEFSDIIGNSYFGKTIIDPKIKGNLLIRNLIDFAAVWDYKFDRQYTKPGKFHNADGSVGDADFMFAKDLRDYIYRNQDFRYLRRMMNNNSFSVDFLLPEENIELDDVIASLDSDSWSEILNNIISKNGVKIKLPKFELESDCSLLASLNALGLKKVFSGADAQIPNILIPQEEDKNLWIQDVIQSGKISIDEDEVKVIIKTDNPDATGWVSEYDELYLDRPFIFIISENSTGAILFMGKVSRFKDFELY